VTLFVTTHDLHSSCMWTWNVWMYSFLKKENSIEQRIFMMSKRESTRDVRVRLSSLARSNNKRLLRSDEMTSTLYALYRCIECLCANLYKWDRGTLQEVFDERCVCIRALASMCSRYMHFLLSVNFYWWKSN